MKQEDTKQKILSAALELFSICGYDAVSVGQIAKAVGIKAPSLYNHFASKRAIFDALFDETAAKYDKATDAVSVHVSESDRDVAVFTEISEDALTEKVRSIFAYSLHDETVARFRRMMTIEQFRNPELAQLYTKRYIDRMVDYHAGIFKGLISAGRIRNEDPETLSVMYVSPIITLLGVCDRQPEKEEECLKKLDAHVRLFFRTFNKYVKSFGTGGFELQFSFCPWRIYRKFFRR